MTTSAPPVLSDRTRPRRFGRRSRRVLVAAFVILCGATAIGAPLPYLLSSLDTLAEADAGLAAHYAAQSSAIQTGLYVHASAAGIALLLTPVQFAGRLRRRAPAIHRWSGRVSLVAIMVAAAGGLAIAPFGYAGLSGFVGLSALALIWAYAALRTVAHARRGDRASHRRWALRVIALTFAGVTLRLWVGAWVGLRAGAFGADPAVAFDEVYALTPFLSWIPNLLLVEWHLRHHTPGRPVGLATRGH